MKAFFAYTRKRVGLGTAVQMVVHAGLAAAPLPRKTKARLKGCAGCTRRAQRWDREFPNINPLAKKSEMQSLADGDRAREA
jgi:hypothetical protein